MAQIDQPLGVAPQQVVDSRRDMSNMEANFAAILGPSGYEAHQDKKRNFKHSRLHIPDRLPEKYIGPNPFIQDRIDGLITDTTYSPFTTLILPYHYLETPDAKIEWNVYSFDEGLASRVPYESAARTLTQKKNSFSGYTVRQGLAITMEHNFMNTEKGIENFRNQVMQIVGSIQNTNDLDVHMALVMAPSYSKAVRDQYYMEDNVAKTCRDYVDTFGFAQKNMNAVDILIEDTKQLLVSWGADEPDFMLTSGKLCFQLTMTQERTSFLAKGDDGADLLKEGPLISKYRGLNVIKSRAFSMEEGAAPRDVLRRRVRTSEYYFGNMNAEGTVRGTHAPGTPENALLHVSLYDEGSDNFNPIAVGKLSALWGDNATNGWTHMENSAYICDPTYNRVPLSGVNLDDGEVGSWLLIRPNIEHYMLGMIIGKGGMASLGATLWGQSELSVFDDGQHGVWGMTYKYHERAIVFNERNLHRIWDVSYDGYCGGKDCQLLDWKSEESKNSFKRAMQDTTTEFDGPSVLAIPFKFPMEWLPSPLVMMPATQSTDDQVLASPEAFVRNTKAFADQLTRRITDCRIKEDLQCAINDMYEKLDMHGEGQIIKMAPDATSSAESTVSRLMYQGTSIWDYGANAAKRHVTGCGHHGPDYAGVASARNGKSLMNTANSRVTTASLSC